MELKIIYQILKADLLERTRRFSFIALCAVVVFLAFFSVPNVEAPFVSICMEPNIFSQGSNPSWVPITIALCGGILFPLIGFAYVKSNINMDRNNGFLYIMQSMNMEKKNYIIGKFLSNLVLLSVLWLFMILSAAVMLPFQFPNQPSNFYDFMSPFMGIYPGIIFVAAFAILLESMSFSNKFGNTIGITVLFVMFIMNYSTSDYHNPLLRILDFSNYRWIMESINHAVIPVIGHGVQETGILVPNGIFSGSTGEKELFFHGLLWKNQYLIDKILLTVICFLFVIFAVVFLEPTEREIKAAPIKPQKTHTFKPARYANQFVFECKMIFKEIPKPFLTLITGLWISSILLPLKFVQGYLWVVTLIFSAAIFSQLGCREHEYNLTEYFITIKNSMIKHTLYSYLWGTFILLIISIPVIVKSWGTQNYYDSLSYIVFSAFLPALSCFLGEYAKSRRAFETVYLILCFLLINMPSFLFDGYITIMMAIGTVIFLPAALLKRRKY